MHEVRVWNVALKQSDLEEHTKNFESVSFQGSTATDMVFSTDNAATYGSLSAHYKLKENVVLTNPIPPLCSKQLGIHAHWPIFLDET